MTTEQFIEKYMVIQTPSGPKPIVLRDKDREFLKLAEKAQKEGKSMVLKPR